MLYIVLISSSKSLELFLLGMCYYFLGNRSDCVHVFLFSCLTCIVHVVEDGRRSKLSAFVIKDILDEDGL